MKYVATGLNMLDVLEMPDGSRTKPQMGGIPMYGYCGMRPWSESILFSARVGKDFFSLYNPWFENNNIDPSGLNIVSEVTPYSILKYLDDGNYDIGRFFEGSWDDSDFWRPKAEDFIGKLDNTKGFYLTGGPPPEDIWNGLFDYRKKHGFKIMWEPNGRHTFSEDRDATIELCKRIDMASFNIVEGIRIFGINSEKSLIEFLKNLGPELVLLRAGERGLYSISEGEAWFIPSTPLEDGVEVVDVTGCGNAATAAACLAWAEGNNPVMTGIMANISAYYNFQQVGPRPLFDDGLMQHAESLAKKLYSGYTSKPV